MANRETYPAAQSPLTGDISGPAGATKVTVVGLQTVPISPTQPTDKQFLRFNFTDDAWEPISDGNARVTLGTFSTAGGEITSVGLPISDDTAFSVNNIAIDGLVGWTLGHAFDFYVNGVGVL